MTREIKFRAWDGKQIHNKLHSLTTDSDSNFTDVLIWPEDGELTKLGCTHEKCNLKEYYGTIYLMQYTGLKDKNGKEIYEGDILRCTKAKRYPLNVMYFDEKEGRWLTKVVGLGATQSIINRDVKFEIIGNIYENPELLTHKE